MKTTLLALVAICLAVPAAQAAPPADGTEQAAYRFELRALGGRAGEMVMTVGATRKVGARTLRPVRMEGRTDGIAGRVYPATADGTTWIDDSWLPVRADWVGDVASGKREVTTRWRGTHAKGEYKKKGEVLYSVDKRAKARAVDTVTVISWVMSRDMTPGAVHKRPYFDGFRFFDLVAEVGEPTDIHIPLGVRKVHPVKMRMTRGRIVYNMTVWVGVADRVPYKTHFDFKALGGIEMVLTDVKRAAPGATAAAL